MAINKAIMKQWVLLAADMLIREFAKNTNRKCLMNIDAIKDNKSIYIFQYADKYLVVKLTIQHWCKDAFYVEYLGWLDEAPTNLASDSLTYLESNIDSFPFQIDIIMTRDGGLGDIIRNKKVLELCGFIIEDNKYYWKDKITAKQNELWGTIPTAKFKMSQIK